MKARIITSKENTELDDKRKLYLVHREITSGTTEDFIAYSKNSDTETRVGTNNNSPNRAISCSELVQKMINKDWMNIKKIFISGNDDFDVRQIISKKNKRYTNPVYTVVPKEELENSMYLTLSPEITDYYFNESWKSIFTGIDTSVQEQIENMIKNGEIYLFNTSKETYDLLEGNNSINLVNLNSDVYTNSIDTKIILGGIFPNEKTTSRIDVSIQYTKYGDEKIYNNDITLKGFSVEIDNNLATIVFNDFTENINNEILLEYFDGIIRVFPISDNLNECIISDCTITYGNLK